MLFLLKTQCYLGEVIAFANVNIKNNHHLQNINKWNRKCLIIQTRWKIISAGYWYNYCLITNTTYGPYPAAWSSHSCWLNRPLKHSSCRTDAQFLRGIHPPSPAAECLIGHSKLCTWQFDSIQYCLYNSWVVDSVLEKKSLGRT